jgi:hypothetical protein
MINIKIIVVYTTHTTIGQTDAEHIPMSNMSVLPDIALPPGHIIQSMLDHHHLLSGRSILMVSVNRTYRQVIHIHTASTNKPVRAAANERQGVSLNAHRSLPLQRMRMFHRGRTGVSRISCPSKSAESE